MKKHSHTFAADQTSSPAECHKILVTGATGFIGGELVPELLSKGYEVRLMIRSDPEQASYRWPYAEVVKGDARHPKDLEKALKGIDCAYYLLHSLHLGSKNFEKIDRRLAINFREAAAHNNVKKIIYLGSLGDPDIPLSAHMRSRKTVAKELQKGKVPVTVLRAAVIVGSGSASYRIIKNLVLNCPFFLFPTQANSKCQPISIRDVTKYLVGCLEMNETSGQAYDIGGPDIVSYQKMLKVQAEVLGKKRVFIPSNFPSIPICARIAGMLTPVPYQIVKSLLKSCRQDAICQNENIRSVLPFDTLTYKRSLIQALSDDSNRNEVENLKPPAQSRGLLSDIRYFLLNKPQESTMIHFASQQERQDFTYRIRQRLEIGVSQYKILNIHKIGVNAPAKYIFEELLKWNGDSSCWPNHIARVVKQKNKLENLSIHLFGWTKFPFWLDLSKLGIPLKPLFQLNAITFRLIPDPADSDNARYLLYESGGGYPIGIFSMYVRSSIEAQQENEQSQLFLIVGFNFYGKDNWSNRRIIRKSWERVHDRVTSNVMNRLKQLSEWRFEKIRNG